MTGKELSAPVFRPFARYTLWPSVGTTAAQTNTAAAASKPDEDQRRPGLGKPAMRPDCPARYQPKVRGTIPEVKAPPCQSRSRRFGCFRSWIRLRFDDVQCLCEQERVIVLKCYCYHFDCVILIRLRTDSRMIGDLKESCYLHDHQ